MADRASSIHADPLLTNDEAATYLSIGGHTLEIWRSTKRYAIPHIRVGRSIRYRKSALDAWLESRMVDVDAA